MKILVHLGIVATIMTASHAMDVQELVDQRSITDQVHDIHHQITKKFQLLDSLPINQELPGKQRFAALSEPQKQALRDTLTLFDSYKTIHSQCSNEIKMHMAIDWLNFIYYISDIVIPAPTRENLKALLEEAMPNEDMSKLNKYYSSYSIMKILNCESSGYARFDLPKTLTTRIAWRMAMSSISSAPNIDIQLHRVSDFIALTMLVETEAQGDDLYYLLKKNLFHAVMDIHQIVKARLEQLNETSALDTASFKQFNQLYNTILSLEPMTVPEALRFSYDAFVTTLYEPEICQEFSKNLQ
jgi:hypothetical protein